MGRLIVLLLLVAAVAYLIPAPPVHYEASIEIDKDRDHVWEVLSDFTQLTRWNEEVDSTSFLTPQRTGVGTVFRIDGKIVTSTMRVTRWEPYNRVDFAVELKPKLTEDHVLRYIIHPRFEDRTLVHVEEEYRMAGGYLGHAFGLLIFSRMRDPYRGSALGYLKRLCETGVGLGI